MREIANVTQIWGRRQYSVSVISVVTILFPLQLLWLCLHFYNQFSTQMVSSVDLPDSSSMRLLFMTLEYKAGTFSGNGIYAMSMVRSLTKLGHSVFVVSAAPLREKDPQSSPGKQTCEKKLVEIHVPVWRRLDWKCGWHEFAAGVSPELVEEIIRFRPQWGLVVDWSAVEAFKQVVSRPIWASQRVEAPPMAYLNYRVYTFSEYAGEDAMSEKEFYRNWESSAVALASTVAALSTRDAEYLVSEEGLGHLRREGVVGRALLPPLREDIRVLALNKTATPSKEMTEASESVWSEGRKYFSCCVRLSPEKNAALFAAIVEHIAPFLLERGIVPLLCMGAGGGGDYASDIRHRIMAAVPSSFIVDGFMGAERLSEVYSQTLLNVHPCLYDAYGMTIVEAAAFGAPSLIHNGSGGAVGAAELLDSSHGFSVGLDLGGNIQEMGRKIEMILSDKRRLAQVGIAATAKSVSWSEQANAEQLVQILEEASPLSAIVD